MNAFTFSADPEVNWMRVAKVVGVRCRGGHIRIPSITIYDRRIRRRLQVGRISFGLYIRKWLIKLLAFASPALPTMSIYDQTPPSESDLKNGIMAMPYSQFRALLKKFNISVYLFSDSMTGEVRLVNFEDQMAVLMLKWNDVWEAYKGVIKPVVPPNEVRASGGERSIKGKQPACMETLEFIKESHKLLSKALESLARLTTGCVQFNPPQDAAPPH